MKTLKNNQENLEKAVEALRKGGVIAHPADTCYGLAGDLMNEVVLKKIQAIKGRDGAKPMSIMLPVYMKAKLSDFVELTDFAKMVCEKLLPGPVTIVLPKGPKIPSFFFPDIETVGIRMPDDQLTNDLLTKFQGPLITTSANLACEAICSSAKEVVAAFEGSENQPELILESQINGDGLPSTVISLVNDEVKILREGPVEKEQLEVILGIGLEQ